MSLRDDVSTLILWLRPSFNGHNAQLFHIPSPISGVIGRVCALSIHAHVILYKSCLCGGEHYHSAYISLLEPAMEIEASAGSASLSHATLFVGALNNGFISAQAVLVEISIISLEGGFCL